MLWRRHRPQRSPIPEPIDPSTDPLPSAEDIDALDARIADTDIILDTLDPSDALPKLPADFALDRPDDRASDLLRKLAGEDDDTQLHDKPK